MSPSRSLIHLSSSPSSNPKFAVNSFEIFLVFRRYIRFLRAGFVTPLSRGPPLGSDRAPGRQRTPRGRRNHTGNSIRRSMKCGAEDYAATFLNPLAPVISRSFTLPKSKEDETDELIDQTGVCCSYNSQYMHI